MQKLVKVLKKWTKGKAVKGLRTPSLETIDELFRILNGLQTATINLDVTFVLKYCEIPYRVEGFYWVIGA